MDINLNASYANVIFTAVIAMREALGRIDRTGENGKAIDDCLNLCETITEIAGKIRSCDEKCADAGTSDSATTLVYSGDAIPPSHDSRVVVIDEEQKKAKLDEKLESWPSYDEALKDVMQDYDAFDDVLDTDPETGDKEINPGKVDEYVSTIKYKKEMPDGHLARAELAKYPKFLALFGAETAHEIKLSDIIKHFAPDQWARTVESETFAYNLNQAFGYLMSKCPDTARTISADEIAYCKEHYNVDLSKFGTVGEVGMIGGFDLPSLADVEEYTYDDDPVKKAIDDSAVMVEDLMIGLPDSFRKQLENIYQPGEQSTENA